MATEEEQPSTSGEGTAKLFLGGLSWDTTEEKLREHFGTYGDIVEAVVMRERATGRPRGFGFVTFKERQVADRVVQDIHVIDGRQIDAKKSVPQEQKPKARKIFVGGIAPETTEAEFREFFEQYGPVTDAQIMQDHMTGRSRGFGFITFEEDDAVERVFAAGAMQELGGKRVEIKHATPKGSGGAGAAAGGGGGGRVGGPERGDGGGGPGGGARVAGAYGRAAPMQFGGQMPGPYGFGMFPYPPGMMPPQAGPYSMGYPSPYLMMQQISGYPGQAAYAPFAPPGTFGAGQSPPGPGAQGPGARGGGGGGAGGGVQPYAGQPTPQQQMSGRTGGGGYQTRQQHQQQLYGYPEPQPLGQQLQHGHLAYPRPLAGPGRGKGKVDSASSLSEHQPHRYLKG